MAENDVVEEAIDLNELLRKYSETTGVVTQQGLARIEDLEGLIERASHNDQGLKVREMIENRIAEIIKNNPDGYKDLDGIISWLEKTSYMDSPRKILNKYVLNCAE